MTRRSSTRRPSRRHLLAACAAVLLLAAGAAPGQGQDQGQGQGEDSVRKGHFAIDNPAELGAERAEAVFRRIERDMQSAYAVSGLPAAERYHRGWRVNGAPYRSGPHGERFVNHWVNAKAAVYAERPGPWPELPEGALLAKDSFTVTDRGQVHTGPLFLMEKMAAGFSEATRDWRYTLVMPDGSLYGRTGGAGAGKVGFCADCHDDAVPAGGGAPLWGLPDGVR
jgi:hypothetical protein